MPPLTNGGKGMPCHDTRSVQDEKRGICGNLPDIEPFQASS